MEGVKGLLLDLDGVLYEGESVVSSAQAAGLKACQVRTGKFREDDLKRGVEPDCILDSIAELPALLQRLP